MPISGSPSSPFTELLFYRWRYRGSEDSQDKESGRAGIGYKAGPSSPDHCSSLTNAEGVCLGVKWPASSNTHICHQETVGHTGQWPLISEGRKQSQSPPFPMHGLCDHSSPSLGGCRARTAKSLSYTSVYWGPEVSGPRLSPCRQEMNGCDVGVYRGVYMRRQKAKHMLFPISTAQRKEVDQICDKIEHYGLWKDVLWKEERGV